MLIITVDGPGAMGVMLTLNGIEDQGAIPDADLISLANDIANSDAIQNHFTGPATLSTAIINRALPLFP